MEEIEKYVNDPFDEKLIRTYIGEKHEVMFEKATKGAINIWALLFSYFYFVYRKMYLVTAVIIFSSLAISVFLNLSATNSYIISLFFLSII